MNKPLTLVEPCPVCNDTGWAWQWRTYGNQQYHGDYHEPCEVCAKGEEARKQRLGPFLYKLYKLYKENQRATKVGTANPGIV